MGHLDLAGLWIKVETSAALKGIVRKDAFGLMAGKLGGVVNQLFLNVSPNLIQFDPTE